MRLLLLHLSDIHIVSEEDTVTARCSQIVDAVKNLDYSLDMCVVIVTGDVAFSGQADQYLVAMRFFNEIKENLSEKLSCNAPASEIPIKIIIVPGNHDCDFTDATQVRDVIVDSVLTDGSKAMDKSIVELCTRVQSPFFNFWLRSNLLQDFLPVKITTTPCVTNMFSAMARAASRSYAAIPRGFLSAMKHRGVCSSLETQWQASRKVSTWLSRPFIIPTIGSSLTRPVPSEIISSRPLT